MGNTLRELPKLKIENLPPLGSDLLRLGTAEMRPSLLNRNDELSMVYRVFQTAVLRRTVTADRLAAAKESADELARRLAEISPAHRHLVDPQLPANLNRATVLANHESRQEVNLVSRFIRHKANLGVHYYLGCRAAQETTFHAAQLSAITLDGRADTQPRFPLPVVLNEAGERGLLPTDVVVERVLYETKRPLA